MAEGFKSALKGAGKAVLEVIIVEAAPAVARKGSRYLKDKAKEWERRKEARKKKHPPKKEGNPPEGGPEETVGI